MLNKKDFLKYASKLAFPIMIQNLIGTLVNIADTVMLGYVSQTGEYPKVCVNLQTDVRYNYSVWRLFLWQEEKTAHKKQQ